MIIIIITCLLSNCSEVWITEQSSGGDIWLHAKLSATGSATLFNDHHYNNNYGRGTGNSRCRYDTWTAVNTVSGH